MLSYLSGYPLEIVCDQLYKNTFIQRVKINPLQQDVQSNLHSDTFFPAFKFWYFPSNVIKQHGCFNYVRNSHTPSFNRMQYEFNQSIDAVLNKNKAISKDHRQGSFRISDSEILPYGFSREEIDVQANTLVIANVFGFHARGLSMMPIERISIHGSLRYDFPFVDLLRAKTTNP